MSRLWRLTIEKSSRCLNVCGSEELLRAEFDAWISYETKHSKIAEQKSESGQEHTEWEGCIPRVIHGISDSADRTENIVAYRLGDVEGMVLTEL